MSPRVVALVVVSMVAFLAPPPQSAAISPAYVVTTINVRHTLGPARAGHDLRLAQAGGDIVLAQEMGSRRASRFRAAGWSSVQAGDSQEVATYWRTTAFDYRGSFPILLHRSHLFSSATRYALATRLDQANGPACLLIVNVHFVPHIERAGHPRRLPRLALVDRATRRLATTVRFARASCAVLIGGDWNVDGNADARVRASIFPFARLTAACLVSEWTTYPHTAPTLGRRHVDGFYTAGARTLSRHTIGHTFSDHNGDRLALRISR